MSIFFSTFATHFKASDLFIAYLNTTTLVVYDLEIRHKIPLRLKGAQR